jgi:hypothetical protein
MWKGGYHRRCLTPLLCRVRLKFAMLRYFLAAFIFTSSFCGAPAQREVQRVNVDTERYAVYSALLREMFTDQKPSLLVIAQKTGDDFNEDLNGRRWDYLKAGLAQVSQDAIDDFKKNNAQPSVLTDKFTVSTKVVLLPKNEIDRFFDKGGGWWPAFYKQYPHSPGLITLSNVGFDPEMNQAILYIGYQCDGLCGAGHFVLMVKANGNWKVEKKVMTWIS